MAQTTLIALLYRSFCLLFAFTFLRSIQITDSQPTTFIENLSRPASKILNSCSYSNLYLDLFKLFPQNTSFASQEITSSDLNIGQERELISTQINPTHFFEGAEKLLEIWFTDNGSYPNATLRSIKRKLFDEMLFEIGITIVSVKQNEAMDAYVLSESSMFVTNRRIVIKTCGRSKLLKALDAIIRLAKKCGLGIVQEMFFSRKNLLKPEDQPAPHRSFKEETEFLNNHNIDAGDAYTFGPSNKDHWNLYSLPGANGISVPDQRIQVLMSDLDEASMAFFYRAFSSDPDFVANASGIVRLFPGAQLDHVVFDPCGYSANGLIFQDKYFTIHVTPEKAFSYVSFETNFPFSDYRPLLRNVLDVFKPRRFAVTLLSNEHSISKRVHSNLLRARARELAEGFDCNDLHYTLLNGKYDVTYATFAKTPLLLPPDLLPVVPTFLRTSASLL